MKRIDLPKRYKEIYTVLDNKDSKKCVLAYIFKGSKFKPLISHRKVRSGFSVYVVDNQWIGSLSEVADYINYGNCDELISLINKGEKVNGRVIEKTNYVYKKIYSIEDKDGTVSTGTYEQLFDKYMYSKSTYCKYSKTGKKLGGKHTIRFINYRPVIRED